MVGSSNGTSLPAPSPGLPPPAQLLPFPPGMDPSQWGWNRPRASGMRPGFMQGGPRRGAPYLSRGPGFFPGHRGPPPQQQAYFNQRKPPRPNWVPRLLRLPHFPANPADPNFANYQPPANWPSQAPPSAPSPATSEDDKNQGEHSQPPKKKKRTTNGTSRPWDRVAAELALKTELDYKKNAGSNALVVKFPDPELSKEIVQRYNSAIDNVHFQGPCSSRYCFVTLKEGANVEQTMKELSEIEFGTGHLTVERKVEKAEENVKPEDIDPYTLFIGNLPANISTLQVKEKFPTALRIDVGYAQKMKYTRYAFARYSSTETALEAYKTSINTIIASRSIVLRFRRNNAPVGPPGEKPTTAVVDVKPGEKLTVGAKLEAKRKKAKREKVQRDKELGCYNSDDDSDDDDRVSLEDDDTDSECVENDGDEEVGDDTDDDGVEESDDEDDDVEDEPVKREPVEDDDDSASDNEAADVCTGTGYIGEDSDDRASDDDEEAMKDGEFFNLLRRKQK